MSQTELNTSQENNQSNARVHGHLVQLGLPAHDRPRGGIGREEVDAATGEGLRLGKAKNSLQSPPPSILHCHHHQIFRADRDKDWGE